MTLTAIYCVISDFSSSLSDWDVILRIRCSQQSPYLGARYICAKRIRSVVLRNPISILIRDLWLGRPKQQPLRHRDRQHLRYKQCAKIAILWRTVISFTRKERHLQPVLMQEKDSYVLPKLQGLVKMVLLVPNTCNKNLVHLIDVKIYFNLWYWSLL